LTVRQRNKEKIMKQTNNKNSGNQKNVQNKTKNTAKNKQNGNNNPSDCD